jgi:hypothetical protein
MDTEPQDQTAPRRRAWIGPLVVALVAPIGTLLLIYWLFPPTHGLLAFVIYGLVPVAAGSIGILTLPLTRSERMVALAVYIPVMGTLVAYQVPVGLMIACALGDCI